MANSRDDDIGPGGLAIILFIAFLVCTWVLTFYFDIWKSGTIAIALVLAWPIIGRVSYAFFLGCSALAGWPDTEDVFKSLTLLFWPIVLFIACPILLLTWFARKLLAN